jgi:hypothetical protein
VVADPEEKARAYRACSRAAMARSKLSLSRRSSLVDIYSYKRRQSLPVRIRAPDILIQPDRLSNGSLGECS